MALQSYTNIDIDFCDKKYILINAKQFDKSSRFVYVTCYNHGEIFHVNSGEHSAYIRYRKADENGVFNFCKIDQKGKIIVELTEQMLATDGICYADLVIVNKGHASVNKDTGEIIVIDNAAILSTMTFCIDVSETSVLNSDIESSYEFNGLNTALQKAEAEYTEVIQLSKSYAMGNAGGIRQNEDTDNSKYYYELSLRHSNEASISAANALQSERNAKDSETQAKISENNSKVSENNSKTSETNAYNSEQNAKAHMEASKVSEDNAKDSETNAKTSENNADISEANAETYMNNANTYMNGALDNYNLAKSYAVGGSGVREGEDTNNAHYYYELVKTIVDGLNSGFIPMGTITFEDLATAEKATGFTYNISNDFITDESFAEGQGKQYTAGTNVYWRFDDCWDTFGGMASPLATTDEVIEYLSLDV